MTYPYYRLTGWKDKGGGKNKEKHILGWFEHFKELGRSFKGCAIWVTGMECRYVVLNKQASMEQLWLAFIMKELYSKEWNGEEWV